MSKDDFSTSLDNSARARVRPLVSFRLSTLFSTVSSFITRDCCRSSTSDLVVEIWNSRDWRTSWEMSLILLSHESAPISAGSSDFWLFSFPTKNFCTRKKKQTHQVATGKWRKKSQKNFSFRLDNRPRPALDQQRARSKLSEWAENRKKKRISSAIENIFSLSLSPQPSRTERERRGKSWNLRESSRNEIESYPLSFRVIFCVILLLLVFPLLLKQENVFSFSFTFLWCLPVSLVHILDFSVAVLTLNLQHLLFSLPSRDRKFVIFPSSRLVNLKLSFRIRRSKSFIVRSLLIQWQESRVYLVKKWEKTFNRSEISARKSLNPSIKRIKNWRIETTQIPC